MAFAAPVRRGNFLYSGSDLFVDVGNLNRHKRATVAEITSIIRPDLNKSKASSGNGKDQVAHWYEAQCIHYGLQPTKDKARAKVRLLEALNTSQLKVPHDIVHMESQMRKEFATAERKAKALYKESMGPLYGEPDGASVAVNRKRKPSESNPIAHRTQPKDSPVPPQTEAPPRKKAKQEPAVKQKQTARSTKLTEAWIKNYEEGLPSRPPPVGFHVGKDDRLYNNVDGSEPTFMLGVTRKQLPAQAKQASKVTKSNGSKPKQAQPVGESASDAKKGARATAKSTQTSGVKKEPKTKTSASKKAESKPGCGAKADIDIRKEQKEPVKHSPKTKKEPVTPHKSQSKVGPKVKEEPLNAPSSPSSRPSFPPLGLINGVYEIQCPDLEREFPSHHPFTLILTLDTPQVWGAYDFGMFRGIIRLPNRPTFASGRKLPFQWRGREEGEGEMSFYDWCQGHLQFLGDGRISGQINLFGDMELSGQRIPGPGRLQRTAASMRAEWEEYNEDNYEAERVGRWH